MHLEKFGPKTSPVGTRSKTFTTSATAVDTQHLIVKGTKKIVCSRHVTYAFQSKSSLYSYLNVKGLLARSRREI